MMFKVYYLKHLVFRYQNFNLLQQPVMMVNIGYTHQQILAVISILCYMHTYIPYVLNHLVFCSCFHSLSWYACLYVFAPRLLMITHMKLNCINQLNKCYNFLYIVFAINSLDRYNIAQTLTIETLGQIWQFMTNLPKFYPPTNFILADLLCKAANPPVYSLP